MLVEINLLPQKEPKKVNLIITLSSILLIIILVGTYFYLQIHTTKSEVASIDQQIAMTKKVEENQSKASSAAETASSYNQLKSAIDWANNYQIQTVPVMQHLTSLLPERGFIQSFAYTEAGTITLTVQFDSAREAAYFLDDLDNSKWISEASLSSLATTDTTSSSTATSTTNQTTTTSSTTTASGQTISTNAPTGTTNDTNSAATTQAITGQSATGTTVNGTSQVSSGTASGTQATSGTFTTSTITGNVTTGTTATSSTGTSTNTNQNILPRYTGQFEIKLDQDYVKKEINKSKNDEKGVTGS